MPLVSALLPSVWRLLWGCNLLICIRVNQAVRGSLELFCHEHAHAGKSVPNVAIAEGQLSDSEWNLTKKKEKKKCVCAHMLWSDMMRTKGCGWKLSDEAPSVQGGCLIIFFFWYESVFKKKKGHECVSTQVERTRRQTGNSRGRWASGTAAALL